MQEVDKFSGLPKDLFDISSITREQEKIRIFVTKRKLSKIVTIVVGIQDATELKELGKEMKQKFACGGTVREKEKEIELQGNHRGKVRDFLITKGYKTEQIDG
jgi:translation initiation factor 1